MGRGYRNDLGKRGRERRCRQEIPGARDYDRAIVTRASDTGTKEL